MNKNGEKRLVATLSITLILLACETIGGYLSNSLALLSDAGHMVTDAFAIALGLIAARISARPSGRKATFGYQRVGLLAALANGLSLLVIAFFVFYESYERFQSPLQINIPVMIGIATLGFAGNIIMVFALGHSHEDLNLRSVWLHVLGDTLSSVGVIISGIVVYFTGWSYADPIAGAFIGLVIVWGGVRLVRDTVSVFLNLTPRGFDVEELAQRIIEIPDVEDVHDVHLWPIAHKKVAFSAHVLVNDQTLSEVEATKANIEGLLRGKGITHSTLQIECTSAHCGSNGLYCRMEHDEHDHVHDH